MTVATQAVGRLVNRQIRRGAVVIAAVCAGMSAIVAIQYRMTVQISIDESGLRALAENPAIRILFGPPVALDDPGGFTVWRTATPVLVLASVWILLAATRVTRGEEDAGRLDLLLAGRLRMVDVLTRCIAHVSMCALMIGLAVGVALVAARTDATGAVVYAVAVVGVMLTFGSVGLLAGQVMPTRATAIGVSVAALGVALLLRMLADSAHPLAWVAWTTPFGLTARAAPYYENRVAPLIVLAAIALTLSAVTHVAAQYRDAGSGMVVMKIRRQPRIVLLSSLTGFAMRRAARPTAAWAAGIGAYFLLVGALIASILEFFDKNPIFAKYADAAGAAGLATANGFAAALFSLLAIPTGLYGATRLAAIVADERARRWTPVLSAPISRTRLLCTEIQVTAAGVLVLHVVAALAIWTGSAITGTPLGIHEALAGALNSTPIGWLGVAAAALAAGWFPTAVLAFGALPVAGGFLLNVVTSGTHAPRWIVDLSPFAHLAPVPDAEPNWLASMVIILVGAVLIAAGMFGYHRRDLTS